MSKHDLFKSIKLDAAAWKPFFTSDIHLLHANAAKHRGFNSLDAMHEAIRVDWNLRVEPGNLVIILGDVAFARSHQTDELIALLNRLNGRKWLVPGNHDARMDPLVVEKCFERVLPPIQDVKGERNGKPFRFTLCHFPIISWNMAHHGACHLHGHSHGSLDYDRLFPGEFFYPKMMDVGVDTRPGRNLSPYSLDEILTIMDWREFIAVDHHKAKEEANT